MRCSHIMTFRKQAGAGRGRGPFSKKKPIVVVEAVVAVAVVVAIQQQTVAVAVVVESFIAKLFAWKTFPCCSNVGKLGLPMACFFGSGLVAS